MDTMEIYRDRVTPTRAFLRTAIGTSAIAASGLGFVEVVKQSYTFLDKAAGVPLTFLETAVGSTAAVLGTGLVLGISVIGGYAAIQTGVQDMRAHVHNWLRNEPLDSGKQITPQDPFF